MTCRADRGEIGRRACYGHGGCRSEGCVADNRAYLRRQKKGYSAFNRHLKQAFGCSQCGYDSHPDALEVDHIERIERRTTGRAGLSLASYSPATQLRALLDGTRQILCANCHAIKSQEERRVQQQ